MKITPLELPEVLIFEPKIFEDQRGFFFETYKQQDFNNLINADILFKQDSHSKSYKGVLRGLHYQIPPMDQGKLIRVIKGEVFDVAVDLRLSSPTFGKYVSQILSETNKKQIWIPKGFAHGFLTLSNSAELIYKMTSSYSPNHERSIIWNDSDLAIAWPKVSFINLSSKDLQAKKFSDAELFP
jgi:dTDP-4-dehydrorhamnose 3,5-epimerase